MMRDTPQTMPWLNQLVMRWHVETRQGLVEPPDLEAHPWVVDRRRLTGSEMSCTNPGMPVVGQSLEAVEADQSGARSGQVRSPPAHGTTLEDPELEIQRVVSGDTSKRQVEQVRVAVDPSDWRPVIDTVEVVTDLEVAQGQTEARESADAQVPSR